MSRFRKRWLSSTTTSPRVPSGSLPRLTCSCEQSTNGISNSRATCLPLRLQCCRHQTSGGTSTIERCRYRERDIGLATSDRIRQDRPAVPPQCRQHSAEAPLLRRQQPLRREESRPRRATRLRASEAATAAAGGERPGPKRRQQRVGHRHQRLSDDGGRRRPPRHEAHSAPYLKGPGAPPPPRRALPGPGHRRGPAGRTG